MTGINIPYERIIETVQQKTGIAKEELEAKIDAKLKQLSGLISRQGAAHIIANELGVKLVDQVSGRLKIGNILSGMRDVETEGSVVRVFEQRTFETERGPGKVASFLLGDDTGMVRVVLWNDQAEKISTLGQNMTVKVVGGYTRGRPDQAGKERVEVHLNDRSKLIVTGEAPAGQDAGQRFSRKKIRDISEADELVEVLGTVYQVFDPRFFEICPQCGRRARAHDSSFACDTHGQVTPDYSYVLNLFLDDGTSTIRLVCFREQALRLLNTKNEDFLKFRQSPESFETVKNDLLGQIIKVMGRTTKNDLFDRLELIAQLVYPNPDPQEELERIEKESAGMKGQDA